MILYPKKYIDKLTDIDIDTLKSNDIRGIILDVDNTLIDYEKKLINGIDNWCREIKKKDIKLCILSNSNNKDKVKEIADKLDIPCLYFGTKPLKRGFKKAKRILNLENKNIAVVGDQIFTDILGANRCNMFSILVKPINEKDIFFVTKIVRNLEKIVINKYKKQIKTEGEND